MDTQPDTHEVDRSEIRTQILLATASSALKGRQSFTHMLTEVRPDDDWFLFVSTTVLQEICEILQELYFLYYTIYTFSVSTHFTSLVCVSQFYSQVLLTSLMFSFLMSSLLFRESKADVEAPVFPMESAVVSAHSKCQQITRRSHRGRIRIK